MSFLTKISSTFSTNHRASKSGSKYDVVVFVCSYRFTSEVNLGYATRVLEFDNNKSHTL
jgi:hypothetical protein